MYVLIAIMPFKFINSIYYVIIYTCIELKNQNIKICSHLYDIAGNVRLNKKLWNMAYKNG